MLFRSALPLGLLVALAGTSAFANTGTLNFTGSIIANTCPIEVVNPGSGAVGNTVQLGAVSAADFTSTGDEAGGRGFQLRVTPGAGCDLVGNKNAEVTFRSVNDNADPLYALNPIAGAATGVAVAIKDHTGKLVNNSEASDPIPLNENTPTLLQFPALYKATAATVTAGPANADVNFTVAIN